MPLKQKIGPIILGGVAILTLVVAIYQLLLEINDRRRSNAAESTLISVQYTHLVVQKQQATIEAMQLMTGAATNSSLQSYALQNTAQALSTQNAQLEKAIQTLDNIINKTPTPTKTASTSTKKVPTHVYITFTPEPPTIAPVLPPTYPIGDINLDCIVDDKDKDIMIAAFGSVSGGPGWDSRADLNSDNKIDIFDYNLLVEHYGEKCP